MPNNLGGHVGRELLTYRGRLGWQYFPIGPVSLPPPWKALPHPGDPPAVFELPQLLRSRTPTPPGSAPVNNPAPRGNTIQVLDALLEMTAGPGADVAVFKPRIPTQRRVDNPKYDFGRRPR